MSLGQFQFVTVAGDQLKKRWLQPPQRQTIQGRQSWYTYGNPAGLQKVKHLFGLAGISMLACSQNSGTWPVCSCGYWVLSCLFKIAIIIIMDITSLNDSYSSFILRAATPK